MSGQFASPKSNASHAARAVGVLALAASFVLIQWGVLALAGFRPESFLGAEIGAFLGLISLVFEIALVTRAERTFHAQGVQTTFMSFMMRLATVGPLTMLFMKSDIGVDPQAFALTYCGTFFLYMCWLAFKTYHAPALYRPKAKAALGDGIVVKHNARRASADSAAMGSKR